MSRGRGSSIIPLAIFLTFLIIVLPVNAYKSPYTVPMQGSIQIPIPGLVNVVRSIPGAAGADLDGNVNQFVQPSVDVMILGGEPTFFPVNRGKDRGRCSGGENPRRDLSLQPSF